MYPYQLDCKTLNVIKQKLVVKYSIFFIVLVKFALNRDTQALVKRVHAIFKISVFTG